MKACRDADLFHLIFAIVKSMTSVWGCSISKMKRSLVVAIGCQSMGFRVSGASSGTEFCWMSTPKQAISTGKMRIPIPQPGPAVNFRGAMASLLRTRHRYDVVLTEGFKLYQLVLGLIISRGFILSGQPLLHIQLFFLGGTSFGSVIRCNVHFPWPLEDPYLHLPAR